MLVPRTAFTATLLLNGKVLLAGGQTSDTANTTTAELFDPVTATTSVAASMSGPRSGHTATLLETGKVLVTGGITRPNGQVLASSEIYDPVSNMWSRAAAMTQPRINHAALRLQDGRVLVVGGSTASGPSNGPLDLEVYDPQADAWTSYRDDNRPNGVTAVLLSDGRVLIVGGWAVVGPRTAEFFDPAAGGGVVSGRVMVPYNRDWATAALLPDGGVIVAGGRTNGDLAAGALNTTDLYEPGDTWIAGPAMRVGHCHNTLTTLANGVLLIAGGRCGAAESIAVAELYDPNVKTWAPATSLLDRVGFHSAVLLKDGRVLVAGGQSAGGVITASTEVYRAV